MGVKPRIWASGLTAGKGESCRQEPGQGVDEEDGREKRDGEAMYRQCGMEMRWAVDQRRFET